MVSLCGCTVWTAVCAVNHCAAHDRMCVNLTGTELLDGTACHRSWPISWNPAFCGCWPIKLVHLYLSPLSPDSEDGCRDICLEHRRWSGFLSLIVNNTSMLLLKQALASPMEHLVCPSPQITIALTWMHPFSAHLFNWMTKVGFFCHRREQLMPLSRGCPLLQVAPCLVPSRMPCSHVTEP